MSSMRNRNKFCLSLDGSSSHASDSTVHLNRWSEVVPPKTALTFAALWDPAEGMVTFSGAALLESESLSGSLLQPDVLDDDSQFISVDTDESSTIGENTATLATFQDAFKAFLHRTPWNSKEHLHVKAGQGTSCCLQSRASSTFDGLDVYSHDVQLKRTRSLQLSHFDLSDIEPSSRTSSGLGKLRLRPSLMPDSNRPGSESDSSSKSRLSYLKSRFSTTTTSTSNYVDVTTSALQSQRISETSPVREWTRQEDVHVSPVSSWPSLPHRRRLLRKRRPVDGASSPSTTSPTPSTPRKVTAKIRKSKSLSSSPSTPSSSTTTSTSATLVELRHGRFPSPIGGPITSVPTPPASPTKSPRRLKLRFSLLPRRKSRQMSPDSEGWVCIEVTPTIRQYYIENLDHLGD